MSTTATVEHLKLYVSHVLDNLHVGAAGTTIDVAKAQIWHEIQRCLEAALPYDGPILRLRVQTATARGGAEALRQLHVKVPEIRGVQTQSLGPREETGVAVTYVSARVAVGNGDVVDVAVRCLEVLERLGADVRDWSIS